MPKTAIMLWAYSCVLTSSKNSGKKTGNFEKHQAVLSEVEEKYDELRRSMAINIHCVCGYTAYVGSDYSFRKT